MKITCPVCGKAIMEHEKRMDGEMRGRMLMALRCPECWFLVWTEN